MSWRQFKTTPEGFKGSKGSIPPNTTPIKPLRPLKPAQEDFKDSKSLGHDLNELIQATLIELHNIGSWEGFSRGLSPDEQKKIREARAQVDKKFLNNDRQGLIDALRSYKNACLLAHNLYCSQKMREKHIQCV